MGRTTDWMIPLLHDFGGETVLIFGGGPVGARKARRFVTEATVVVVSPCFADVDFGGGELVRARPDGAGVRSWLDRVEPALVVAATDEAALNERIETLAREQGRLVNRADTAGDRSPGSVVLPAIARDGPVVVGVGTGGASPALSAHLRDRIADQIAGAGEMARLTAGIRETLADRELPAADRHAAVRAVVEDSAVWKALDSGGANPRQLAADVINDVTPEATADVSAEAISDPAPDAERGDSAAPSTDARADATPDASGDAQ